MLSKISRDPREWPWQPTRVRLVFQLGTLTKRAVALSPRTTNVQYSSSFCKGASGVLHTMGSNTVISAVSKA